MKLGKSGYSFDRRIGTELDSIVCDSVPCDRPSIYCSALICGSIHCLPVQPVVAWIRNVLQQNNVRKCRKIIQDACGCTQDGHAANGRNEYDLIRTVVFILQILYSDFLFSSTGDTVFELCAFLCASIRFILHCVQCWKCIHLNLRIPVGRARKVKRLNFVIYS